MLNIKSLKLALFVIAGLMAAGTSAAVVPTDSLYLRWTDSTLLTVSVPIDANGVEIRRNTRLIVTPVITGEDGNSKTLPAVEFATRRNRKYNDRMVALEKGQRNSVYGTRDTVEYVQKVEVEEWMLGTPLTLQLVREKEGCCNITMLSEDSIARTAYVPPFVPVWDFVPPLLSVAEEIARREPVLRPSSEYKPFDRSIPLAKMKGALYVHFKVSSYKLEYDYMDNAVTLDKIVDMMKRIEKDSTSSVVKVCIIGLASPEGPVAQNERLALNRAKALKEYISDIISLPESCYEVIGAGEAWADLQYLVETSDMQGKEELLDILRNTPDPTRREQLLRSFNGGKAFDYLKQQIFVGQRNSGYIQVYYDAVPDKGAETINRAVELVRNKKFDEAIALLEKLDDVRKYNTLGVAYFMTGRKTEALECFEKAAENGNPDAKNNIDMLKERNEE